VYYFQYDKTGLTHFCSSGPDMVESSWNVMTHGDAREGK
jgi:hypothetical protein